MKITESETPRTAIHYGVIKGLTAAWLLHNELSINGWTTTMPLIDKADRIDKWKPTGRE